MCLEFIFFYISTALGLVHRRHPCFPELFDDQIFKGRDDHFVRHLASALFALLAPSHLLGSFRPSMVFLNIKPSEILRLVLCFFGADWRK